MRMLWRGLQCEMGVSENRGPSYSTPISRILFVRTPKKGIGHFRKLPDGFIGPL